jgi:hypothetical protein
MSDIISISNLPLPCTRVLQALDNAGIQTVELLTLDVFEIRRRTQLSVIDVQKLVVDVINALGATVDAGVKTAEERMCEFSFLTTGDARVDGLLGGGIPTGCLTEVSGERYDILDSVNVVVLESRSYVYNYVSTFNSLGH